MSNAQSTPSDASPPASNAAAPPSAAAAAPVEGAPASAPTAPPAAASERPSTATTSAPAPEAPPIPRPLFARRLVPLLFALYAVLAVWNAPRRDFWGDEALRAQVAREMAASATLEGWLVPTLGGDPFLANPPLTYWLSGLSGYLCRLAPGLDPHLAYRLPSLAFALASLWLTLVLGRRLFDERIASLAAVIQATTALFFFDAAWLASNLAFATCFQLALGGFLLATREQPKAKPSDGARWLWLGWLGLAGASLLQSALLACALVVPILVLHLFLEGGVRRVKTGLGRVANRPALIAFLILVGGWYTYVAAVAGHGHALVAAHFEKEHVERFAGALPDARPPYYYLLAVFAVFLPWSLFLPMGLLHSKDRTDREGERACLIWFLVVLVALSAASSKRPSYLLTLLPAAALMTAAGFLETKQKFSLWEDYLRGHVFRLVPYLLKTPAILTLALAVASLAGLHEWLDPSWLRDLIADKERRTAVLVLASFGSVAGWIAAGWITKALEGTDRSRWVLELARGSLFLLFILSFLLPALDPVQSARSFLEKVDAEVGSAQLATYGAERPASVRYYLPERDIQHFAQLVPPGDGSAEAEKPLRELEAYLGSGDGSGAPVYLLASAEETSGLKTQYDEVYSRVREVLRGRMGTDGEFVLLRSGPEAPR